MARHQLGQPDGVGSPAGAGEVDQLCNAFALHWKEGERPDISAYLLRVDATLRWTTTGTCHGRSRVSSPCGR